VYSLLHIQAVEKTAAAMRLGCKVISPPNK
jgi:hypothetical protein